MACNFINFKAFLDHEFTLQVGNHCAGEEQRVLLLLQDASTRWLG